MEEADSLCQRIAILDHGRLLALGSPTELKQQFGADTVITLTVDGDPQPLERAATELPGVRRAEVDGKTVRVLAAHAAGVLPRLVEAARIAGLEVLDATSQPPSLETVFLNLTGREYRE
jgi:ABC-2 type transport system ATP-binding protein